MSPPSGSSPLRESPLAEPPSLLVPVSASQVPVSVRNLVRTFPGEPPQIANDQLSFDIHRGEIFGLLGPNGAGKTTLVMQLMGLMRPTSGHIQIEHVDVVRDPDAVKSLIGFLPQGELALNYLEVERALHYTGRLRGQSEHDARTQSRQIIEQLGLGSFRSRYVNHLSGGMSRLVGFGMALMGHPRLLILDEPTNELDPHKRRLVWDTLDQLNREQGLTCLLVTHNVLEAERVIHRLAVMDRGRIIALGTPQDIKQRAGGHIRLELQLKEGLRLEDRELEQLRRHGQVIEVRGGHYRTYLDPQQAAPSSVELIQALGLERVEDLRLAPPSLEEVYLDLDRSAAGETPALPPPPRLEEAAPSPRRPGRHLVALKYLWIAHMLEVRHTWAWNAVFSLFMPVAMVFGLSRIGMGLSDRTSLLYIVSGAAVFSVATEGILTCAQRIAMMRKDGRLIYYASLPISQASFVASIILSRVFIVFPGVITPLLAGWLLHGIRLELSPWLLVVIPLTALSFSGVGMMLGSAIRDLDLLVVITNALISVLLLAAPVFIPEEALPSPLRAMGFLLPPTYAADALRRALDGAVDLRFAVDLAVLAAMTLVSFAGLSRWMRWRVD
ncbi:ABC transporter ATP-binding protein/permease [Stigmatella sp. ncwal1]|uniref:ABC transporter ATP-binding protein/permease n=1 Tax=Stigmatella ashevillensis TaxID=2995309 RepID=A0ABT5D3F5_9BACT|nr:ABC transporter ATP-binding protein/permease [Stigmatella ashevillena]MDC0708187.1 ABC transporter ATP-binding protein/permease [Stigmatella ashevillena]